MVSSRIPADVPWGCPEPVKCPFCNPVADEIVAKNDPWHARWDRYPVSEGHLLMIPFRHTPDFFPMTVEENQAVLARVDT